jgi:hypothetical protein
MTSEGLRDRLQTKRSSVPSGQENRQDQVRLTNEPQGCSLSSSELRTIKLTRIVKGLNSFWGMEIEMIFEMIFQRVKIYSRID